MPKWLITASQELTTTAILQITVEAETREEAIALAPDLIEQQPQSAWKIEPQQMRASFVVTGGPDA